MYIYTTPSPSIHLVIRTLKICPVSNFQICNMILLLFLIFIYLFEREKVRQSMSEEKVRERSRLPVELGA